MNNDETTISIMGEEVAASHVLVPIQELLFLPDNPRVYAAVREMPGMDQLTIEERQQRIFKRLLSEPSVRNLIPEIKRDGGLQEPIIVRWDTKQVIEGNSRLAVYRHLHETSRDVQWTKIRCLIVAKLTHDQQTRLLGQSHLHGKTDWSRYAKALFCYRWVIEEDRAANVLHDISGITVGEIKKNVKVIQLMNKSDDDKQSHFSHYEILVRNRAISSALDTNEALRETLLAQIKTGAFTAQQLRDRLPAVITKPRILRKYEREEIDLEDAYDRAKTSTTEKRLKSIRDRLDDIERGEINKLERNEIRAVQQVVKQIRQRLQRVSGMVDTRIAAIRGTGAPGAQSVEN